MGMRYWPLVLALLLPACSDDESEAEAAALTCDYLSDPSNCWATAAAAMAACLPGDGAPATLEADRTACAVADGTEAAFDEPLPDDLMDMERLAFSLQSGGATCARFVDTFMNRMELTGGGKTVVSQLHGGGRFELDCGDQSYEADFDLLFDCPAGTQPTDGFDVEPDLFMFMILSVSTPGEMFRCETAGSPR